MFREFNFIVIDEVHEREIDSDFGMVALKLFMALNKMEKTKILIMSATMNAKKFIE